MLIILHKAGYWTNKEYLIKLAGKVKVWRNVTRRNRQRYQQRMQDQYNRKLNVPNDLQPGELVYMKCPYLNVNKTDVGTPINPRPP